MELKGPVEGRLYSEGGGQEECVGVEEPLVDFWFLPAFEAADAEA